MSRVVVPLGALPLFLVAALPLYTVQHRLLAWAVFTLGTAPMLRYLAYPNGIPLIELVGVQYAIAFGVPVFFESELRLAGGFYASATAAALTLSLACAGLAFLYILLGYGLARSLIRFKGDILGPAPSNARLLWYGVAVVLAAILVLMGGITSRLMGTIDIALPRTLGLAVLACLYFGATLGRQQRLIIVAAFVVATVWGLLAGMTQLAIEPLIIWVIARWALRARAPVAWGIAIVAAVLVLQPVKGYYRQLMGSGMRNFTAREALDAYVSLTREYWSTVSRSGAVLLQGQASVAQRLSMLQSTARYIEMTPTHVPYKGPRTLLYPTYSWMPRLLWPDKPSAQEANKVLPVDYGIQSPENLATTMFGVGHVAEVYTGLGLAGIMPVFFVLGILYAAPKVLLANKPGLVRTACVLWFATHMMYIESTIGTVFGGLTQQFVVLAIVFRLLTLWQPRSSTAAVTDVGPNLRPI